MSKKQLPSIKRTLKTFILDEDAKVIDKTATKLAILASFMAINTILNSHDANAKGHGNHTNHNNDVNADGSIETEIHAGNNPMEPEIDKIAGKSVLTYHGNHYNHGDESGSYNILKGVFAGFGGFLLQALSITDGVQDWVYDREAPDIIDFGVDYVIPDFILKSLEDEQE